MLGSSRSAPPEDTLLSSPSGLPGGASGKGAKNRRATRYEVQERLGEGSLWIVYRVRPAERSASGSIALKALRGAGNRHTRLPLALDAAATQWNALSHPHLASPIEWGIESGTSFFTAPLLTGGSLFSRIARAPLGSEEALRLLHSMANALNYIHGKGIVHGDVRPRQILFDSGGFPILTDGGHAGALSQAGLALADLQPDTAFYLAPERAAGSPMSPATDMYSLGVTFYAALAGRVPFEGSSPLAVAARHRHETPPAPSSFNSLVTRDLDDLALRLLSKTPDERPSAFELERLLQPRTRSVSAPSPAMPISLPPYESEDNDATVLSPAPVTATAPKRRPLNDLVQETLDAQDEQGRQKLIKKAKRRHVWREFRGMIGAILFLVILIGGGIGAGMWAYNTVLAQIPQQVVVPKYLGLSQDKAKQALAKAGLYMKVTRESYDPKVPAGTVMEGDPEEGRKVRARREVFVTVSAGEAPIKMVDFSALTLDQARTIILQHGMRLGSIAEQYDNRMPRGAIIGQFPEPGDSFSRAQAITLVVSRGPQPKELDAQNDELAPPDPLEDIPASPDAPFDTGDTFAPLEPAGGTGGNQSTPAANNLETRSARVRVTIPKDGGTQIVRIIVRDAKGERTVYQKAHVAGDDFNQKVTVSRSSDQQALVRVFVGEQLVTEEQI
ncbi:serine/threonine-protein kinase PrkC [Abditibacteriota bacterium]|nr:serine/threonine-protein kinase PrkC [Abditibacteriota bacterium]